MKKSKNPTVAILCSGVTLGVYNPALILCKRLEAMGTPCKIYVLENLLSPDKRENIPQIKKAFHRNYALAINSQKMTGDISATFNPRLVDVCLDEWASLGMVNFCLFSGFWLPMMKKYQQRATKGSLRVNLCHMDAVTSTSWKPFENEISHYRNLRLFDHAENKVAYQLAVADPEYALSQEREERVVIHGGGWGIGSYQQAIAELEATDIPMDIICYEKEDIKKRAKGCRNFMIDPQWKPWETYKGKYSFPPFAEVKVEEESNFKVPTHHPDVYDLATAAWGIISKPGGATLLDSFSSATPLIFLPETFGEYERRNGELWQSLGFGIDLDTWKKSNYSINILKNLHKNICNYKQQNAVASLEKELYLAT